MNITIYYLSKRIILQEKNQNSENQLIKDLDLLKKTELLNEFELFINQTQNGVWNLKTSSMEKAIGKFGKIFKLIYAAGGLITKDGNYLFIFRLKKWDLPKGKLDKGETPEKAAVRECEEECGITQLTITGVLDPTYHIYPYKGAYALKKTFWYAMKSEHSQVLVPQLEEDIERVEWFSPAQISETVVKNTYPAILDVISHIN